MPSTSRIGDIGVGICCCHPPIPCIPMVGPLITGAGTTSVENSPPSRCGDIIIGYCGHPGIMITCSGKETIEGAGTTRIGDLFAGCFTGALVTGAGSDITGG
ncbi:hypothetical protein KAR91_24915 [Candidatus Pacearchaeota archaeon]|nr:hypothetical protein [Candidatus Pacearchaeota archaeon]